MKIDVQLIKRKHSRRKPTALDLSVKRLITAVVNYIQQIHSVNEA